MVKQSSHIHTVDHTNTYVFFLLGFIYHRSFINYKPLLINEMLQFSDTKILKMFGYEYDLYNLYCKMKIK